MLLAQCFYFGCRGSQGCSSVQPQRPHTLLGFYLGGCGTMTHLCLFLVLPGQGQLSHWNQAAWRRAWAVWSLSVVQSRGGCGPTALPPEDPSPGSKAALVHVIKPHSLCSVSVKGLLAEACGNPWPGIQAPGQNSGTRRSQRVLTLSGKLKINK